MIKKHLTEVWLRSEGRKYPASHVFQELRVPMKVSRRRCRLIKNTALFDSEASVPEDTHDGQKRRLKGG